MCTANQQRMRRTDACVIRTALLLHCVRSVDEVVHCTRTGFECVTGSNTHLQTGCTLAPPGKCDGSICAAIAMRPVRLSMFPFAIHIFLRFDTLFNWQDWNIVDFFPDTDRLRNLMMGMRIGRKLETETCNHRKRELWFLVVSLQIT